MGTTYSICIKVQPEIDVSKDPAKGMKWEQNYAKFVNIVTLDNNISSSAIFTHKNGNPRMQEVGKWSPEAQHKYFTKLASKDLGLIFSVMSLSEYGDIRVHHYQSGVGFLYSEQLLPEFNVEKAEAAMKERLDEEDRLAQEAARVAAIKKAALEKLSLEERAALGV